METDFLKTHARERGTILHFWREHRWEEPLLRAVWLFGQPDVGCTWPLTRVPLLGTHPVDTHSHVGKGSLSQLLSTAKKKGRGEGAGEKPGVHN